MEREPDPNATRTSSRDAAKNYHNYSSKYHPQDYALPYGRRQPWMQEPSSGPMPKRKRDTAPSKLELDDEVSSDVDEALQPRKKPRKVGEHGSSQLNHQDSAKPVKKRKRSTEVSKEVPQNRSEDEQTPKPRKKLRMLDDRRTSKTKAYYKAPSARPQRPQPEPDAFAEDVDDLVMEALKNIGVTTPELEPRASSPEHIMVPSEAVRTPARRKRDGQGASVRRPIRISSDASDPSSDIPDDNVHYSVDESTGIVHNDSSSTVDHSAADSSKTLSAAPGTSMPAAQLAQAALNDLAYISGKTILDSESDASVAVGEPPQQFDEQFAITERPSVEHWSMKAVMPAANKDRTEHEARPSTSEPKSNAVLSSDSWSFEDGPDPFAQALPSFSSFHAINRSYEHA